MNDLRTTLRARGAIKHAITLMELYRAQHGPRLPLAVCKQRATAWADEHGLYTLDRAYAKRRWENSHAQHAAWMRIESIMPLIRMNPFIRAVAVANSVAFNNLTIDSDIDVFIVAARKRVWLARLLVALPAKLLHLRPGEGKRTPVCLSFFVDEDHLNLEPLTIPRDIYMAHWIDTLIWIHDPHDIRMHLARHNAWVERMLKRNVNISYRPYRETHIARAICVMLAILNVHMFESLAKYLQSRALPARLKAASPNPSGVYITDTIIKMHGDDARAAVSARYEQCDAK